MKHTKINTLHIHKQHHTLSKEDIKAIVSLMENGLSLQESMKILKDKTNESIFLSINEHLKHGETLTEFFYLYVPLKYRSYLEGFMKYMTFQEALSTSIDIVSEEEKNQQEIIRGMLYPTLLLIGMICGIFLFNEMILPNMITLMAGFSLDSNSYMSLQKLIRLLSLLLMVLSVLIIVILYFLLHKRNIVKTYCYISQVFPNSILSQNASEQFAQFFLECMKRNISTQNSLLILSTLKDKPLVSFIASCMDEHLNKGESLQQAIKVTHVEATLLRFFTVALYASDCEGMLKGYLEMVKIRKMNAIKRYSRNVQLFSYSIIGVVLIFVYRILMMPMNMLQNI